MGNAFTAVVDDTSAFFYNPAALARNKDHELKFSLGAGGDTKVVDFYHQVNNAVNTPGGTTAEVTAVDGLLTNNFGNYYSVRGTVGAFYMWPHWEIAFIPADLSTDMQIHQSAGASLNVNGYNDSTLALSYAHELNWVKDHQMSWGVTLKSVYRLYVGADIQAADLVQGTQIFDPSLANEGLTFDADLGYLWTPAVPKSGMFGWLKYFKPTFAVVGQNLVNEGFHGNLHLLSRKDSDAPPPLGRRLNLGSKWELPHWWVFDTKFAFDERDIGDDNFTFKKGLHAGAEFYWTMFHWWRGHWSAGINQGYFCLGVGAKLAWFQFDFATYGEEVGTQAVPLQSRRYMGELALDF